MFAPSWSVITREAIRCSHTTYRANGEFLWETVCLPATDIDRRAHECKSNFNKCQTNNHVPAMISKRAPTHKRHTQTPLLSFSPSPHTHTHTRTAIVSSNVKLWLAELRIYKTNNVNVCYVNENCIAEQRIGMAFEEKRTQQTSSMRKPIVLVAMT